MASDLEPGQSIMAGTGGRAEVVATRDPTNGAKDTFNIVPRRHYLSRRNLRETKGRNTRETGPYGNGLGNTSKERTAHLLFGAFPPGGSRINSLAGSCPSVI